ncbi:tyrosinase family protein [Flavobacterium sp. MDT1-60]|uniref:tyrosinase family protein n=1 Tax=Flavobacterium sp. MDT1-60 TaxID=1979344 RepID=UPI00177E4173|nr:tyrosinase family protein [Flavobacterium sp. MDT1-60]QOG01122.1 tyrosinase family protein [Flavobacterium sp. MDT1-60]
MKFILKINGSEDKNAEFVGWTPVKCTLTVDGYGGDLPMPVTITPEHINKAGRIDLYLDNATSATPVKKIEHDFQNANELTFYVAGKYGHASIAERIAGKVVGKDTFIYVKSNNSDLELKKEIMVRVRKNANKLDQEEMTMFLEAFVRLSKENAKDNYPDPNNEFTRKPSKLLDEIVLMHTLDASNEIHGRTSFHPWHRAFLLHLERELQRIYPEVAIPYWKFDEKADRVFTSTFIGETKNTELPNATDPRIEEGLGEQLEPAFDQLNPMLTYSKHIFWGGALKRAYRNQNPVDGKSQYVIRTEKQLICEGEEGLRDSFSFWSNYEERGSHNGGHLTFTGHIVNVGKDPVDPLFFMMHSNVDRLWALWQQVNNRFNVNEIETYPHPGKYSGLRGQDWAKDKKLEDGFYYVGEDDIGNFAEDTLWPWGYDFELSRPMRKWETKDLGGDEKGKVPQINIKFPNSPTSRYPYPYDALTVRSTIDYQGKLSKNNEAHQGFDYDDIPYFDSNKKPYVCDVPEFDRKELVDKFFNEKLATKERLKAADEIFLFGDVEQSKVIEILNNKNEETEIRLKSLIQVDDSQIDFLDSALEIIADKSEPIEIRSELIHKLVGSKRSNRAFSSRRSKFFNILRGLIKDENQQLRFQAIEILAAHEDEIVQEFLIEELKKERSEFISKPDAIFFLRESPKPQHVALFRDVFEKSEDLKVRKAAIEGLGDDPHSIELLKKVVTDVDEKFKVREAGALSLHHLDKKAMNDLAAEIIAKPEPGEGIKLFRSLSPDPDEVDFKAGLLNMLTFTGDPKKLKENEGLKSSLMEVMDSGTQNKANFRSNMELFGTASINEQTIIEKLAAELMDRLESNDND